MSRSSIKPPQPPPPPSKKRLSTGSGSGFGSSFMDPDADVIEIPPPFPRGYRSRQRQAIIYDVIDIDKDDESADIMILDVKPDKKNKGKALENNSGGNGNLQTKDSLEAVKKADSDLSFDEPYFEFITDFMDAEDLAMIQAHFDSVDLPAGVEAPLPWFPDFSPTKKRTFEGSSSSGDHGKGSVKSSSLGSSAPSLVDNKANSFGSSSWQNPVSAIHPVDLGSISANANLYQSSAMMPPSAVGPPNLGHLIPPVKTMGSVGNSSFPNVFNVMNPLNNPQLAEPAMSQWKQTMQSAFVKLNPLVGFHDQIDGVDISPQEVADIRNQKAVNEEDILRKFKLFKKFDTVKDFSDHHYSSNGVKQPAKNWVKKIQDEWRILENDLPDTISVRVCETRMDLLRAVIIGAEGTPYHDGLFFFDVFFPSSYPQVPPNVYYHSGGLRLNPNLYECGKVCLSLLNTWSGDKNEMWIPGMSTMLQVLVSIQALILNQKPYFNEPGHAYSSGTQHGEMMSQHYNERTLVLSLKTMMYTMRRQPKHFEDFVAGHFYIRANDIIVACKAYLDGAQVGCSLVRGGIQDGDEGNNICSKDFKDSVARCVNLLVKEFTILGVKDMEKFLIDIKSVKNQTANTPTARRKSSSKPKV
ncbi:hypothetical protein SLE2022_393850 [Rubroshorea leprosula]